MDHAFATLNDIQDVVIIPLMIFAVGALLSNWFGAVKACKVLALIQCELKEMEPRPKELFECHNWAYANDEMLGTLHTMQAAGKAD